MGFATGETIVEGDLINASEKNATPSNDADKAVKLEADGRFHNFFTRNGQILTAGATINGGTLPVPVYQNKTDNELYACDANDATAYKFIGFAISNSTNGNPIAFQGSGVVTGFSGLSEGEKYYVQDTAGTIGTTPGTVEILVGVAISQTDLLIQKSPKRAAGSFTDSGGATNSQAITTGFRPSRIKIWAVNNASDSTMMAHYVNGAITGAGAVVAFLSASPRIYNSNSANYHEFTITSVTDTGFTITYTETGGAPHIAVAWEAEGEL